ncbi:MAG: hypothetical protein DCF27_12640 [Lysobacteraceae bacterium]|nr:MAG: hypothetical protein DCF27_12640 [Xanthomonadaceae bacterium]
MRIQDRVIALLLSLALPVLSAVLLVAFTMGTIMLSTNDRAILWATGTPAQLDDIEHQVHRNPWFKHGRTRRDSENNPLPPECDADAREFSFASLGEIEAQAAREILELIASRSGARICLTNMFVINELPDAEHQNGLQKVASVILATSLLPCATVFFIYILLARKLNLATFVGNRGHWTQSLSWGFGAGAAASLALALAATVAAFTTGRTQAVDAVTLGNVGLGMAFALVLAVPVMEEIAFRGWMLPLAQRAVGALPAATLSAVLYAVANLPDDGWSALGYLGLGAIFSALFLRTRSLLACMVAHVQVSAWAFWLA